MFKVDLHTHSSASPDGAITSAQYQQALDRGVLDCVAVTDHNTISFALELQHQLGSQRVIVGEEINTTQGELIGLFLTDVVPPGLTPQETIRAIHNQGGLVYVPHPFETVRKGVSRQTLDEIAADVDLIEVHNGRAVFQNFAARAAAWAIEHGVPGVASSDAHGYAGWGRTYSLLTELPTRDNLVTLLAQANHIADFPGVRAMLYPKFNRLRKTREHRLHAD